MIPEQETDVILNQHGEATELTTPSDFGNGLAFLNPAEMPDLDTAEIGFNIQPESIEFKTEGESLRAVFNGFTIFKVKDQNNEGVYLDKKTAVLQTKNGIKINMGANLVKQLELVPVGTAVQVTYKGEQKTNGSRKVKVYEVVTLNVPRMNVPAINHAPAIPATVSKPVYKNLDAKNDYWKMVNSMKMTNEEGNDHLKEFGYDFAAALDALTPGFIGQAE